MNIENPVLSIKSKLEHLQNTLTEDNFLKHIQDYFSEEIIDSNRAHLINKFWGNIWIPFHQLTPLLDKIQDLSFKSSWGDQISILNIRLKNIESFTRNCPHISFKENNSDAHKTRRDLKDAISSTVFLCQLGEIAVSSWEDYKKVSNIFIDRISNFKTEILNSILNDNLKEKLIDLLSEMDKLLRGDFFNESKFKEKYKDTYIYLSEEKDNPNNTEAERNFLSGLLIKWREFCKVMKYIGDKSVSPAISFGLQALQLSSGN